MTHLVPIFERFERRLVELEDVFAAWIAETSPALRAEDHMFLEGLVSTVWQHWSLFCRRLVFASALGCTTRGGIVISACVTPVTWGRVSHIACQVKNGKPIQHGKENLDLWKEPTWGDLQKLHDFLSALQPQNVLHLTQCFGAISRGPVHVQVVRNASAHRNHQSLGRVRELRAYYNVHPIRHPVEAVTWVDPTSRDYAFVAWLDEMRLAAHIATD